MDGESIPLIVQAPDGIPRRGEPVRCGIPLPRGFLVDPKELSLFSEAGLPIPSQKRVLDAWPDGSVRWLLLDWRADVNGRAEFTARRKTGQEPHLTSANAIEAEAGESDVCVRGSDFQALVGPAENAGVFLVVRDNRGDVLAEAGVEFQSSDGEKCSVIWAEAEISEPGPLRAGVFLRGTARSAAGKRLVDCRARIEFFASHPLCKVDLTLCNSQRALHPGGLWDLGDPGSLLFRGASVFLRRAGAGSKAQVSCSPEPGQPSTIQSIPFTLRQESSGGENWQSTNHFNRNHEVALRYRGYRMHSGHAESHGLRATPMLGSVDERTTLGLAVQHFWQNFPMAVEAGEDGLTLKLLPSDCQDLHELQGGESKSYEFWCAFGPDATTDPPWHWCRCPSLAYSAPAWNCATGAIPHLLSAGEDPNTDYMKLVNAAVEGNDTFEKKREVIDEYGWRHFGEIYGDHEAVFHPGPRPLVSHYNNQYDPVAGFALQFLRSGDPRWHSQMCELARHVRDIDIYHTQADKSAYNGGLFWHTCHYVDADTGTHRSYPKAANVCGGGPADEHNYTTGALVHYFLTGDPASREVVLGLAQWVLDMDDGAKTVFRWLDRGPTGLASRTVEDGYHGPGRGAGNSINALVDAHRLSGDRPFLAKAEELIRRCVHPADTIAERNLLNAEKRWSYTVFFQAIGKYLNHKAEFGELDNVFDYARASLLHYARWMVKCEYPILDKPEQLEYPTETWAAQDMRKSEVFCWAAKFADKAERATFLERSEFFFRYSTRTLMEMKTRTLARPVIVLLSNGLMHSYFQRHPEALGEGAPTPRTDFGAPVRFVAQKARAKKRFKILIVAIGIVAVVSGLALWLVL